MSRYALPSATLLALGLAACAEEPTRPRDHPQTSVAITAESAPRCFGGRPFVLTELGTLPGGTRSRAEDINNHGEVVGWSEVRGTSRAFLWTAEAGFRELGVLPGGSSSVARAINDRGQVVGGSSSRAFLWTAASGMRELGTVFGETTVATDINERTQVIGQHISDLADGFIWTADSGIRDLGDLPGVGFQAVGNGINDRGLVVGGGSNMDTFRAFLRTPSGEFRQLGTLPGEDASTARDINNSGQVVGFSTSFGLGGRHPFIWTAARGMRPLPLPDGSLPLAITDRGQVAGETLVSSGGNVSTHAFVATLAGRFLDLGTLPGSRLTESRFGGINNHGQVAGSAVSLDGEEARAVLWTLLRGPTPVHELRTIRALAAETQSLVARRQLTPGQARALVLTLQRAFTQLETRHRLAAIARLREYVTAVRALINGGELLRASGQPLIDAATCVITRLTG